MIKSFFSVILIIMIGMVCDRSYANDWVYYNSYPQPLALQIPVIQTQYVQTVQTTTVPVPIVAPVQVVYYPYPIVRYIVTSPIYVSVAPIYSYRKSCFGFRY